MLAILTLESAIIAVLVLAGNLAIALNMHRFICERLGLCGCVGLAPAARAAGRGEPYRARPRGCSAVRIHGNSGRNLEESKGREP